MQNLSGEIEWLLIFSDGSSLLKVKESSFPPITLRCEFRDAKLWLRGAEVNGPLQSELTLVS